ncbi:MAG: prepilin-type N-terminal cleavage/methylation domain-containing protein [SAR202 cluster bacterium]|nr:prepilin-type N-terminal cleavage/methylation domain-containing protein [SAR202 cluster bacterium]
MNRKAFTLIELLVVVAIIGILAHRHLNKSLIG